MHRVLKRNVGLRMCLQSVCVQEQNVFSAVGATNFYGTLNPS